MPLTKRAATKKTLAKKKAGTKDARPATRRDDARQNARATAERVLGGNGSRTPRKPADAPVALPERPQNRKTPPVAVPRDEKGRFPAGQSGNPGGRPRSKHISDAYRSILAEPFPGDPEGRTYAEIIALGAIRSAIKHGDVNILREITDRTEGRARQAVELTGKDGGPLDIASLTPEQRDAELAKLAGELGYTRE